MVLAALLLPASAHGATPPPRVLARPDGSALAGPRKGNAHDIALAYVRAHLDTLGLKDLDTLGPPEITRTRDLTQVRWPQEVNGVRSADSELRVNLAADGSVV